LKDTALEGATQIKLNDVDISNGMKFDWKEGEEIVIASTDFDAHHAETRIIESVEGADTVNPIVKFKDPLKYKHYAGVENYGDKQLEMRAEVGLLTRNVKFQGS
jgi:hypothetical protein